MTRPELHALVDIVMDARERMPNIILILTVNINSNDVELCHFYYKTGLPISKKIDTSYYPTFSDFTQAVQEYIKTLEG